MTDAARIRLDCPRKKGLSGVEMIFMLVFAGLIIGTAAYFINMMRRDAEVTDMATVLSLINMNLPEIYASQPDFGSGSLAGVLIGEGILPRKFVKDPETLVTAWGDFEIEGDGGNGRYIITLGNVPGPACRKLCSGVLNSGNWSGLRIGEGADIMETGEGGAAAEIASQCGREADIFITGDKN